MLCKRPSKLQRLTVRVSKLLKQGSRDAVGVTRTKKKIVIINVYRPPQGDYKGACRRIGDSISKANLKDNAEIYLMGDFNINLKDRRSPQTKELEFVTSLWGLKAMFNSSTRLGQINGRVIESCIDNIFTNSNEIIDSRVLDWNFSDHLAIAVKRKRVRQRHNKIDFVGRSYKNYDRNEFQISLIDGDWREFYASEDPASCWDLLEGKIRHQLDQACPQKKYRVREITEAWVTNEILELIKDKDRMMNRARRSGSAEDLARARRVRNRVGRIIEEARADFLKEQQEQLEGDPKRFWRLVKTIVPGKTKAKARINLNDDEGRGAEINENEVAGYVNEFFTSIGPNLAKSHNSCWEFLGEEVDENCPRFEADFELVFRLCKEINTTKSSGFNDISSMIFKDAFVVLVPQLVYLFNLSFATGRFPNKWKEATIIPLFKGGNKNDVGNYRPVSLLPIPGKIIERVVHANLSKFLNRNEVITDKKGGFRKGFSTMSSIADLTDDFFSGINKGLTTLAVFIDLRKAFDTVDHNILARKLRHYGIREANLVWCKNYLSQRLQKTLANGQLSEGEPVRCGVPQESVLGPMFFILYVNDMLNSVVHAKVQLYADDTVIYCSGNSTEEVVAKLQPDLDKFSKWCGSNKLTLNVKKTKLMSFGTRERVKKTKGVKVYINGKQLQHVPTYKYLGMVLDSTLSLKAHVSSVVNTVLYKTNLLSKIRKFISESVALRIFKTMIVPYFDYGDVLYSNSNSDGLEKLQRLQNRCLKICMGLDAKFNTNALHRLAKCPKLSNRREAHVHNFMFKRTARVNLIDNRNIQTRAHDALLFKVKIPKNETYKRSVEYSGAVKWNALPANIREIDNYPQFKHSQKVIFENSIVELN